MENRDIGFGETRRHKASGKAVSLVLQRFQMVQLSVMAYTSPPRPSWQLGLRQMAYLV